MHNSKRDVNEVFNTMVDHKLKEQTKPPESSADNVNRHLQELEDKLLDKHNQRLSPEEQLFTEEELAKLINPDKLQALMNSGDDLVGYLTCEINQFESD